MRKDDKYFRRVYSRGRYVFVSCEPVQSQTWITADVDIVKDRPQLLSVIDVLGKRHINTYTPTNWDDVFPGMVEPDFDYTEIVDAIEKDDLVAASDGSVMKNKGGAAFCLARKDGTILYQYSTRVHGDVGDIHSTRTEMVAILGIVVFLRKLERRYKFTKKPVIEIFSYSAMAIKAATEKIHISIKNVFEDDVDIKTELR